MVPHMKHTKRPHLIQREIDSLRDKHHVTKALGSSKFHERMENVLKGIIDGSGRHRKAIRKLQEGVVPVSRYGEGQENSGSFVDWSMCRRVKPVNDLKGLQGDKYSRSERVSRCKLASLYRLIDRLGWSQLIFNHISLRSPCNDEHFLLNAFGLHYSEVTAANLVKVDSDGNIIDPGTTSLGISRAGYLIHSAIHQGRDDINCIIHVHTPAGAAVSSMTCGLLSLCQESMTVCPLILSHDLVILC
jgi:adducin